MPALLLDEMLSPAVAIQLRAEGFDVAHVRERGLLGASDPIVFACAFDEGRVLVTANGRDFLALAKAAELHVGVVIVPGDLQRSEQLVLLRQIRASLSGSDLTNQVATVSSDGAVRFEQIRPDP